MTADGPAPIHTRPSAGTLLTTKLLCRKHIKDGRRDLAKFPCTLGVNRCSYCGCPGTYLTTYPSRHMELGKKRDSCLGTIFCGTIKVSVWTVLCHSLDKSCFFCSAQEITSDLRWPWWGSHFDGSHCNCHVSQLRPPWCVEKFVVNLTFLIPYHSRHPLWKVIFVSSILIKDHLSIKTIWMCWSLWEISL